MPTDLENKSSDFLQGYDAAMTEVSRKAVGDVGKAHEQRADAKPTFWGNPSQQHYVQSGKSEAEQSIAHFAFEKGHRASLKLSKSIKPS